MNLDRGLDYFTIGTPLFCRSRMRAFVKYSIPFWADLNASLLLSFLKSMPLRPYIKPLPLLLLSALTWVAKGHICPLSETGAESGL